MLGREGGKGSQRVIQIPGEAGNLGIKQQKRRAAGADRIIRKARQIAKERVKRFVGNQNLPVQALHELGDGGQRLAQWLQLCHAVSG